MPAEHTPTDPIWTPSAERIARANMTRFLAHVRQVQPAGRRRCGTWARYTHGRSPVPTRSGQRCGGFAAWWRRTGRGGRRGMTWWWASSGWRRRCRRSARGGSRERDSISPRTCCDMRAAATPWSSGTRADAGGGSAAGSSGAKWRPPRPGWPRLAWAPATGSPASCRTCPRPSSPCWPRPAWARSGRPARRTSASTALSIASARFGPRS